MKNVGLNTKLTPAARQALEELVEDYRNQILIGAKESASRLTGDIQEISVHDILTGVNRSQSRRAGGSLPRRIESVLNLYFALGIAIGFAGLLFFVYTNVYKTLDLTQQLPLIIAMTGFAISVFSFLYLRLRQSRVSVFREPRASFELGTSDYSMSYIRKWQEIELATRNLVASRLGESSANEPISVLVAKLRQDEILDARDEAQLREFLYLRNKILHEGLEVQREQLESAIKDADRILNKLIARS